MSNRFARQRRQMREQRYMDFTLIIVILFLLAFGLIMIYSTSSYEASMQNNDSFFYFKRQLAATILGLIAMVGTAFVIDYKWLHYISGWAYGFSYILILLIVPFGYEVNGAKRWIRIAGISLQPAEVVKVAMIIFLASYITRIGKQINTLRGIISVMLLVLPMVIMIWKLTDNLSSAIIVAGIAAMMVFVATPNYRYYIMAGIGVIIVAVLLVFGIVKMADSGALGFRGERVLAWLDPEAYASGKGFQTLQALYAIGSGGFLGKGLGQSMQKLGFLPEAQNDMIFSIICEELGLLGAFAIMLMFIILLWRMMIVAMNATDSFGALIVVGVIAHVAIQVILNIAVVTNTIPNTGISLPFISYGGSASLFLLIEMGLVLNVARKIQLRSL